LEEDIITKYKKVNLTEEKSNEIEMRPMEEIKV
jgi:hypothetical protein